MALKLTTQQFIEQASKKHNNRYDYSKAIYTGIKKKILIICPIHGELEQSAEAHLLGCGCKDCHYDLSRMSLVEFIERANKKHNNKYDYSKVVYKNSYTKVSFIEGLKAPNSVNLSFFTTIPDVWKF